LAPEEEQQEANSAGAEQPREWRDCVYILCYGTLEFWKCRLCIKRYESCISVLYKMDIFCFLL